MTYPQAIVIAAALIAGALVVNSSAVSQGAAGGGEISAADAASAWVLSGDGRVMKCTEQAGANPGSSVVSCFDHSGTVKRP